MVEEEFTFGYTVVGDLVRYIGIEDDESMVRIYYIPKKRYDMIMEHNREGHTMDIDSYRHDEILFIGGLFTEEVPKRERLYYQVGYRNRCKDCRHSVNINKYKSSGVIFEEEYDSYIELIDKQREKDLAKFEKFRDKWVENLPDNW